MKKLRIASLLVIGFAIAIAAPGPRGAGPAEAHELGTVDPNGVIYNHCREVLPSFYVDYAAADELVPDRYTVAEAAPGSGLASLFITVRSCESMVIAGKTEYDTVDSHMFISLVPYDDPSCRQNSDPITGEPGTRDCPDAPPHPSYATAGVEHDDSSRDAGLFRLEFYLVDHITNSRAYAHWLRHGTGLDDRVRVVPGLEFNIDDLSADVTEFSINAPAPAPSPYTITGAMQKPDALAADLGDNFWADTDAGTAIIFYEGLDSLLTYGGAEMTVTSNDTPENPSPLGSMFRAGIDGQVFDNQRPFADPALASSTLPTVQGTKCVRSATNPCSPESHLSPEEKSDGPDHCTADERRADLRDDQTEVFHIVSHFGPDAGQDLTTLRSEADLTALAAGDPESGTAYGFMTHQFVSFAAMGIALANTGGEFGKAGRPDLLFYAPNPNATNVTDPYGADFPYTLAGWAYIGPGADAPPGTPAYEHGTHPTFLGPCIVRGDWFVHERGIHPADNWGMHAVPPEETVHGTASGQEPILGDECDDPTTLVLEPCPQGFQHARVWDIHLFPGANGVPSTGIFSPKSIPGVVAQPGDFYYPDGGTQVQHGACSGVHGIPGVTIRLSVPAANVEPLVPDPFVLHLDAEGNAELDITLECSLTSFNDGPPRDSIQAHFGVIIDDPEGPPQTIAGNSSNELFHQYLFWDVTNNPDWVKFWRDEGGISANGKGMEMLLVEDLIYSVEPAGEPGTFTLTFEAPPPTPSPFKVVATVVQPSAPAGDIVAGFWSSVPRGVMTITNDNVHGLSLGAVREGIVTPEAGSEMDVVFCDDLTHDANGGVPIGPAEALTFSFLPPTTLGLDVLPWTVSDTASPTCASEAQSPSGALDAPLMLLAIGAPLTPLVRATRRICRGKPAGAKKSLERR